MKRRQKEREKESGFFFSIERMNAPIEGNVNLAND